MIGFYRFFEKASVIGEVGGIGCIIDVARVHAKFGTNWRGAKTISPPQSLAWEALGWQPAWFAEIEPFPCAVLSHHWPHIPNHGDMTQLVGKILNGSVEAPDVLVGGTPCQAFSVAGLRGSLDDERGNLTLTLIRILDAIDFIRARNGQLPCIFVWENVPGVLNTRDNAFGCFLGGLAGENMALKPAGQKWTNAGCVLGHKRRIAWRILDAQYFGVPQRRRRVFLVASASNADPAAILFERAGETGHPAAGGAAEQNPTAYVESSFGTFAERSAAGTVKASGGGIGGGSETLIVAHCIAGNTIERQPGNGGNGIGVSTTAHTLTASDRHAVQHEQTVRRLTPLECERLQGMPDHHTRIPWRGKPAEQCPDAPRYKAIGNSMAVPVMHWIGQRIKDFFENRKENE